MLVGFSDELEKISTSHGLTHVSKVRTGTRPISVERLLEKDREGTWQKKASDVAVPAALAAATLAGGYGGYRKGQTSESPRPIEGALRGAWGAGGGALQGALMGIPLDAARGLIHPALRKKIPTGAITAAAAAAGGLGGYKYLTRDKKLPPSLEQRMHAKHADSMGNAQDVRGDAGDDPGAAQIPHRKGETPTKGDDNISVGQKTGAPYAREKLSMSGYQEITQPISSGEEMRAGNSKPRAYGEVPSQDASIDVGSGGTRVPSGRLTRGVTDDPSAKKPKSGDTPTQDRNMNLVDRNDLRESTTTVTGLGQNSSGIGAFNSPSEHV